MRLNRVLLLAASINMAMLATVFTISCSGDDGKNGESCRAEENGLGGVDIYCGNVKQGTVGAGGGDTLIVPPNGDYGDCTYTGGQLVCGGVPVSLPACNISEGEYNPFELTISCVGQPAMHLCGGRLFEPSEKKFCTNGQRRTVDQNKAKYNDFNKSGDTYGGGTNVGDPVRADSTLYGAVLSEADFTCDGLTYNPNEFFCQDDILEPTCGGGDFNIIVKFCQPLRGSKERVQWRCGSRNAPNGEYTEGQFCQMMGLFGKPGDKDAKNGIHPFDSSEAVYLAIAAPTVANMTTFSDLIVQGTSLGGKPSIKDLCDGDVYGNERQGSELAQTGVRDIIRTASGGALDPKETYPIYIPNRTYCSSGKIQKECPDIFVDGTAVTAFPQVFAGTAAGEIDYTSMNCGSSCPTVASNAVGKIAPTSPSTLSSDRLFFIDSQFCQPARKFANQGDSAFVIKDRCGSDNRTYDDENAEYGTTCIDGKIMFQCSEGTANVTTNQRVFYDYGTQFCRYNSSVAAAAWKAEHKKEIEERCSDKRNENKYVTGLVGDDWDGDSFFCNPANGRAEARCEAEYYNPNTHFCWDAGTGTKTIAPWCESDKGTTTGRYNPADNFCSYDVSGKHLAAPFCGPNKLRYNVDGWKGQYCGRRSADSPEYGLYDCGANRVPTGTNSSTSPRNYGVWDGEWLICAGITCGATTAVAAPVAIPAFTANPKATGVPYLEGATVHSSALGTVNGVVAAAPAANQNQHGTVFICETVANIKSANSSCNYLYESITNGAYQCVMGCPGGTIPDIAGNICVDADNSSACTQIKSDGTQCVANCNGFLKPMLPQKQCRAASAGCPAGQFIKLNGAVDAAACSATAATCECVANTCTEVTPGSGTCS